MSENGDMLRYHMGNGKNWGAEEMKIDLPMLFARCCVYFTFPFVPAEELIIYLRKKKELKK